MGFYIFFLNEKSLPKEALITMRLLAINAWQLQALFSLPAFHYP
jgi:hypothetical protein